MTDEYGYRQRAVVPRVPRSHLAASGVNAIASTMASVLIVDEDADTRMLFAERLRHHRLSILLAGNFVEACAVVDRQDVAIVVLQLNRAGANGFDKHRKLRTRYRTIRIAVTTDWMEPAVERLAHRLGADVVFRKPFTTDQLTAVDQLLAAPLLLPAGSPNW